jgi:tetratricopeptide (TPR) repeat protein
LKKNIIVLLLLLSIVICTTAEDLLLVYAEGEVLENEGGTWYEIFIGDMLTDASTIKIGPGSMVEIDANGKTLLLNKPGTYKLGDLISQSSKVSAWGNNPVFKKFLSGDQARSNVQTAVMGVRGSATESDDVEWLSEDSMIIDEAIVMIGDGEFNNVIDFLSDEIDFAFDEELSQYNYYIGYSHYMLGSSGKALSYLDKVDSDYEAEYYPDYVVLKGSLLLESVAYNDALDLFNEFLRNDDFSSTAQAVNYLSAIALKGLGKDKDAEKKLEITVKMNPSSEIGMSADELLKNL